jgi:oxygen-independent coproporphyrinogen-3 oxidase
MIKTIYIGGGTPSIVDAALITQLLENCKSKLFIDPTCEITIETNPDSLNKKILTQYRLAGINRLSIGLQAWQNRLLDYLGRSYDHAKFEKVFKLARDSGFQNINIDTIFGIPTQTMSDWEKTIKKLITLSPEHISCYSLELDNHSLFGNLQKRGLLHPADEKLDRDMYYLAKNALKKAGYIHYEISNFALPGHECRHNGDFWHHQEYLGIGAGAHSYFKSKHHFYPDDFNQFINHPKIVLEKSGYDKKLEWLMLRLRLVTGFLITDFEQIFGNSYSNKLLIGCTKLQKDKLISIHQTRIRLTARGLDLYNMVIRELSEVI